ncbi:MAG TPA: hypothetical protein VFQ20_11800 [Burkholderiaceae bacterium]|nr:hypothetical protein [Burkholderiaceae bacterium]
MKGVRGQAAGDPPGSGIDDAAARSMIRDGTGIVCNWWRNRKTITLPQIRDKLTAANLDRHIHDYAVFGPETPFISLSAGCVERSVALRLNRIHQASDVALRFATDWGSTHGYLFQCWVVVGLKPAVGVDVVAEEVRDLNSYMNYSDYQLEGEITAKVSIPSGQILQCQRWDCDNKGRVKRLPTWTYRNRRFEAPAQVSNILGFI